MSIDSLKKMLEETPPSTVVSRIWESKWVSLETISYTVGEAVVFDVLSLRGHS